MAVLEAAYENWRVPASLGSAAVSGCAHLAGAVQPPDGPDAGVENPAGTGAEGSAAAMQSALPRSSASTRRDPLIDWAAARYVVNAGAHVGAFTIWAAARSSGSIMAIEPMAQALTRLLEANVAAMGLDERGVDLVMGPRRRPGTAQPAAGEDRRGPRLSRFGRRGMSRCDSVGSWGRYLSQRVPARRRPEGLDIEGSEYAGDRRARRRRSVR